MNILSIILIGLLASMTAFIVVCLTDERKNKKRKRKAKQSKPRRLSYYTPEMLLHEMEIRIMLDDL